MLYSVILLLLFIGISYAVDYSKIGRDLGKQFIKTYGGKNFKKNIADPLTTNKPLESISGKTIDFQIACPSKDNALKIVFIDRSNGEYDIHIYEDLNFDGTYDYVFRASSVLKANVSGVCEHGLVSCDPGTWNNCKFYKWTSDDSGKINLEESIDTKGVGQCECTNSSCSMDLLQMNKQYIISGIVTNEIMSKNSSFMLSDSKYDSQTKTVFISGQDLSQCSGINTDKINETSPAKYYSDSPDFPDVSSEISYQSSKEGSPYQIIHSLPDDYTESRTTCEITKDFVLRIVDKTENCHRTINYGGQLWCIAGRDTNCYASLGSAYCNTHIVDTRPTERSGTFTVELKPYQRVAVLFAMNNFNGNVERTYKGNYTISGDLDFSDSWETSPPDDGIGIYYREIDRSAKNRDTLLITLDWYHWGIGRGERHSYSPAYYWAYLLKSPDYKELESTPVDTNNCPTDPECRIFYEEICDFDGNCYRTVENYTRKNVTIQPYCKTVTTQIGGFVLCADGSKIWLKIGNQEKVLYSGEDAWFKIKRIYDCGQERGTDFDLSKIERAMDSANYQQGSVSFIGADGQNVSMSVVEPVSTDCPNPVCFVSKQVSDTSAYPDSTNKSQFPSGGSTNKMAVRNCEEDENGNPVCPVEEGEVIVKDCSCEIPEDNPGFTKAMSAIGVLEEAAKDIICSSTPP